MNKAVAIALGCLAAVYTINVAANTFYKAATRERFDLLRERSESLARIDREDPAIATIQQLIEAASYGNFTAITPLVVTRGSAVATFMTRHPHLSLGVAVDGDDLTRPQVIAMLRQLNQRLRPHRISVGLAEPIVTIEIPPQATRDDVIKGVTTAFQRRPDYHIALTTRPCRYASARTRPDEPPTNRLYSFGLKGITVVDGTVIGDDLTERLLTELANHLVGNRRERRLSTEDYAGRADDILGAHRVTGRVVRDVNRLDLPGKDNRTVRVTIGLDNVAEADARAYLDEVNAVYATYGITFEVHRIYRHRLADGWKWPLEIERLQAQSESDIFVLLTSTEWISPRSGHLRGLGSAFFGAVLVQTGTRAETNKRLAHELGHLFGLPHTFMRGHVMYPIESGIGLLWSPGSDRLLRENRLTATWHAVKTYRERFAIAVKLAPPVTRSNSDAGRPQPRRSALRDDVWASCGL